MKNAQKPDNVTLNNLISRLKEGRFVIPDFQRDFEWRPWDINSLIRSIFLDYYIGSLLLWKGTVENFGALSCEAVYGFGNNKGHSHWDSRQASPEHIVLDGQQRLTAIHYAFLAPNAPLPNRTNRAIYFVRMDRFADEQLEEAFEYEWISKRLTMLLDDPNQQYEQHFFPLSVVGRGGYEVCRWVDGYVKFWESKAEGTDDNNEKKTVSNHAENGRRFGDIVEAVTQEYQISYIELDKELAVEKVCDIFTQINSRGIRLDAFDLINALLKPKGLQLKHMWREASERLAFVETDKMNVYVLQVMSILKQSYCSPKYLYYLLPGQQKIIRKENGEFEKEILISNADDFHKEWDSAIDALENAIKLLKHPQEFGVVSTQYLPYVSILPVFSALQAACSKLPPNEKLDAQRKIRHWYWGSIFTKRYSGSVESTSSRDYLDVLEWFRDDNAEPAIVHDFNARFRNIELKKENKKNTSVYNGIFNLLVIHGARDWITGNIPQYEDLDDHHIVPKSRATNQLEGININTILNRTPLSADTNRNIIGSRLPNEYLPSLIDQSGEDEVRNILESHFISAAALDILLRNPFEKDDYDAFILERQRTILEAIENLLIKERLDLSPTLRELDAKIEKTELSLRKHIAETLEDKPENLPGHMLQKFNEAIQKKAKKNASIDPTEQRTITDKLPFSDLRHLCEVMQSKACWSKFESKFANKDTLSKKFDQLAELRNPIVHRRPVDEVIKLEGEAAIKWFEETLKNPASPPF